MDTSMANSSHAASTLETMPVEVLLHITSTLNTTDYGMLRRTCKNIEASLLASFTREFFSKRQFMFTEFSLQALLDISNSRFSSSLTHVILGLEKPIIGRGLQPHLLLADTRKVRSRRNHLVQQYFGHMSFINTGQDVEMLAEAFSNLKNLDTVGLRDFYSRSRRRDYPLVEWRSYGMSTFSQLTGLSLDTTSLGQFHGYGMDERDLHISRSFMNVLRALGKGNSRPKHFEVILRHCSLQDHAFNTPKYVEPIIAPVLADLRTLFLEISPDCPGLFLDPDDNQSEYNGLCLKKFLSKLTQLENLRLNFRFGTQKSTSDLLSWLSSPVATVTPKGTTSSIIEIPPSIHFKSLQKLEIGFVATSLETLMAILRKSKSTLRAVSLHKVTLKDHDTEKLSDKVNLWKKFFRQMSQMDLNLSALNLSLVAQELTTRKEPQRVTFNNTKDGKKKNWAGADFDGALRDFTSDAMVDWAGYDTDGLKSDADSEALDDDSISDDEDDD